MICSVAKFNSLEAVGGNSGSRPSCTATPAAFFYGELTMNCKHLTCPLLEISLIPLTRGKYAIVDTKDYDWLIQWKWCAAPTRSGYCAVRSIHRADNEVVYALLMHREILGLCRGNGICVDHINHCQLDNRRYNIRKCSYSENARNQHASRNCASQYKGVIRNGKGWMSRITHHKKGFYLGTFKFEIDAAKAYDKAATELFREFACPNFRQIKGVVNLI